jgi:CRP/FNR family cyclic AMP-dependent transcriptional regulator
MDSTLRETPLFEPMTREQFDRIGSVARIRRLAAGEYLFLLGDAADHVYVVSRGCVEVCFPLALEGTVKDISVETRERGKVFGWSALVHPYRFTLSARGAETSEIVALPRQGLLEIFEDDPCVAYHFTRYISEVMGRRLVRMQALWARELQRALGGDPIRGAARGADEA